MLLSQGLLASTLLLAVKAQDGIDQAAVNIATGFAETLIQHAYTTLNGDSGGAGDAGNGGNQDQVFDATLLDKPQGAADNDASVTQIIQGQVTIETYTRPGGKLFPVTLLPHPRITLAPTSDDPYERIIQAYTGGSDATTNQEITIAEPSGTNPGTIIVDVPGTAYSSFSSGQAGALTIPPSNDNPTATIISALPSGVAITGKATRTIPAAGNAPATVVIQTSWADVPPSTPGVGDAGAGGAVGGNAGGGTSNALIIQTYTGTEYITQARVSTIVGSGDGQGTVVVQVPNQNPGGAVTIPPSDNNPYSTILRPHASSDQITEPVTLTVPPSGTNPGTIIIETPAVRAGQQVTLPPDPNSGYITVVRQPNSPITAPNTITIAPSGGQPGTIIIETPAPQPGDAEITIPAGEDGSYVTIIQGPTGSNAVTTPNTITITGAPGQPGTVIIQTPVPSGGGQITRAPDDPFTIPAGPGGQYVTVFRPHSGDPISVPITLTQPGQNGQPGTIIIETPAPTTYAPGSGPITIPAGGNSPYMTIYRPHTGSPINTPITITVPPSGTNSGTIIVETPIHTLETPKGQFAVTSSAAGGQPITIPPSKNNPYVTIYRLHTGDPITVPITITQSPTNGQPGTIIIETQAPPADTVTETEPGATVTVQPDSPGGYTTIYRPHTGDPIFEPITVTTISGSNGQPGTVIIETQGPITITPTVPGGTATIYTPGSDVSTTVTKTVTLTASGGQQSTAVVIETPPPVKLQPTTAMVTVTGSDGYVTITEQYTGTSVITAIFTTTVTGSGSNLGTVYIETPPPIKFVPTSTVSGTDNYITVYEPFPGPGIITAPITMTQATPSGGQPGTVIIQTPVEDSPATMPLPDPTTSQGPDGYVTVYIPFPGPSVITTSYTRTQAPSGGNPGTVFITTPAPLPATTSEQNLPSTTSGTDGYVTVFVTYPGPGEITAPITRTQPPANGQPGTVFITTPVPAFTTPKQMNGLTTTSQGTDGYVTVFVPYPGPGEITAPITSTQPPANGQPGTVWITTPAPPFTTPKQMNGLASTTPGDDQYVTVFLPYPGPGVITAPITRTQAPSSGNPGTVFITTPASDTSTQSQTSDLTTDNYVTIYTPYPGPGVITAPITITKTPSNGQPGTILIETPVPLSSSADTYVTVYRPYPGPGTITAPITMTQAPSNGQPGTVFIETPNPDTNTATQTGPVTIPTSSNNPYITVYKPYPGPGNIDRPITITVATPSGDQPGTIIIETPTLEVNTKFAPSLTTSPPVTIPADNNNYVTVYRPHTGSPITAPITVTTIAPSGGQPGTVIIETPGPEAQPTTTDSPPVTIPQGQDGYVTVYRPYPGPGVITEPVTVTTIAPTNGQPGTVIIETPAPAAPTSFSSDEPRTTASAVTITAGDAGYVTVYKPYPGPGTITAPLTVGTVAPTNGQPGTVIIETPVPQTAPETTSTPDITSTQGTDGYITVFQPYTGTGLITAPITVSTIPHSNGQPGTIIVETPVPRDLTTITSDTAPVTIPPGPDNSYVTVYRPHTGTGVITAPVTITTIPGVNGHPGTIIIETTVAQDTNAPSTAPASPGSTYVTEYRPYPGPGNIDQPIAVTTIEPSNGNPGTVIIETPTPDVNTKVAQPPVTVDPSPDDQYVTIYRPYTGTGAITAPVTVTTIAPSGSQPGTVIIETPVASATSAPPQATYVTVYRPHTGADRITAPVTVTTIEPSGDQPGTVVIETPDLDLPPVTTSAGPLATYVTVYRPHTGADRITEPVTITTIEPTNGQPGTVIIETPGQQAPPVTTTPAPATYITVTRLYTGTGQITEPITTTIPPQGDEPGTVIVETPGQQVPPVTSAPGPASYVTITRLYTGTDQITEAITSTIPPQGDQPGTVVIETPGQKVAAVTSTSAPPSYVTTTVPYTGTDQISAPVVTTVPPQGNQPGTVIVETQAPFVTVYRQHTGPDQITGPVTVTTIAPTGDQPGTVVIETPGAAPAVTTTPPAPSYVTITTLYTGTEILTEPKTVTTIPPQGDLPGTVVVETQGPFVTISTLYTGTGVITAPTALTTIPPQGGQPGTVVVGTPGSYITTTVLYTGTESITGPTAFTTIPPQGDQPGTVFVGTPGSYVITTVLYTGIDSITGPTALITISPQGNQPGTVVIATPPSYITTTIPYTGTDQITAPITATTIPPSGDQPGTFVIETQAPFVTIYRPHTGIDRITAPITVSTIAPSGDQPGTIVVETPGAEPPVTTSPPAPTYTTVYEEYSGTDDITEPFVKTSIEPQGDQPGTIIFDTPAQRFVSTSAAQPSYVTVYQPHSGPDRITAPVTVTTIPPQGDQPGTVIIETPGSEPAITSTPAPEPSYVTVYQPHTGLDRITEPVTITTIPPQGDQPGTVIIETPGAEPPVTSGPAAEPSHVTIYQPHTGADRITAHITLTTIPPQGDQPGTVIIKTPGSEPPVTSNQAPEPSYITVYQPYTGTGQITSPITVTTIAPVGDQPGTVIIATPGSAPPVTSAPAPEPSYVTVYRPYTGFGQITAPVTVTTVEPQGDQPGTVIIETPVLVSPVTSAPAAEPTYITVYRPYTGFGRITAPVTVTTIEPQGDQPGTVVIETPGSELPVTSTPEPAPQPSYVTIYRPHTGADQITAPVTITTIEPQGDQPGTVIIETPGSELPVTSTPAPAPEPSYMTVYRSHTGTDQITATVTITTIEPQGDQPGTVIIETPDSEPPVTSTPVPSYTTIYEPYTGTGEITGEVTVTTIPPQGDQPGTVIIETPGPQTANKGANPPLTIPAGDDSYVTVFRPYTGTPMITAPVTVTTISPSAGNPGTVIIETPPPEVAATTSAPEDVYVTVYTLYTGTDQLTAPITVITIAPVSGTGTVIIETQAESTAAPPPVTIPPSDNSPNITIVRQYPGPGVITAPVTSYEPPSTPGQPGTIIIETPAPLPETTSEAPGTNITLYTLAPSDVRTPITSYAPPQTPGQPGTVFIQTVAPDAETTSDAGRNVTIYTDGLDSLTAPYTTYYPPGSPGDPGTVLIETPPPPPTGPASVSAVPTTDDSASGITTPVSSNPDALTLTPSDSNDDFTVIEPNTRFVDASENITQIIPATDGTPGTQIIYTPVDTSGESSVGAPDTDSYVTISATVTIPGDPSTRTGLNSNAGSDAGTTGAETNVIIIPPSGTEPGTVLSQTSVYLDQALAEHANVTITRPAPSGVTTLFTTYSPPAQPTDPGTIIIEVPDYNVTITRAAPTDITTTFTTYSPPATPGDPGTVIVETPDYNVTITREAPASITSLRTSYAPPGTPGDPGTIAIIMPNQRVVSTSQDPSTTEEPGQNVTVYRPGPRTLTGPITSYIPPASRGDNGTVMIETPGPATPFNVTITHTISTITAIYTTYAPPGAEDDPGTIIVEMPPDRNVTITEEVSTITAPYTTYSPPGSPGDPGTVIMEVPPEKNVTVTEVISTITSPYTRYSPPANRGDPGTVYIGLPPDSNVTITTEVDSRTAPYTTYYPPGSQGDPGTILVELPPGRNVTVTTEVASRTAPYTTYSAPANRGDPGTIIVEMPPDSNVTITTEVNSRTAPFTTYSPPENMGDPGTIIVELPPDRNVTITTEVDSLTAPYTKYAAAANKGDPGTVIVEMPPDRNVTITTEVPTRTAPYTTYSAPGTPGDPGTIIVELPPDRN
ncbi:hypothetical protein IL306_007384, partial [Fusarium sp. DS 682]